MLKVGLILVLLLSLSSCTTGFKKRTLISMAGGFAGGYIAGAAAAPDDENKHMHGALYGAAASSLVGAGMIYLMDDSLQVEQQKKIDRLSEQVSILEKKKIKVESGVINPSLESLPNDLRTLINPGSWKLFEINQWIKKGNTLIHQDKELIFEPSKLK